MNLKNTLKSLFVGLLVLVMLAGVISCVTSGGSKTEDKDKPVNLAVGKEVLDSSTQAGKPAKNAVDGKKSTRWASDWKENQWIYVDLGKSTHITKVVLRWETAFGLEYRIEVSDDAENWTEVFTELESDGDKDEIELDATGRYVKMYGLQRATQWGYSIYEFEIYGDK